MLIEECAEIGAEALTSLSDTMNSLLASALATQQRATKLLRFGVDEIQPGQPFTNSDRLGMEVGDLLEVVEKAIACGLISRAHIEMGRERKRRQLAKFMQTSLESSPSSVSPGAPLPSVERSWEIWAEGYRATGERGFAHLMGTARGKTFREACKRYFTPKRDHHYKDGDPPTYWACRLYDNEADARRSFG